MSPARTRAARSTACQRLVRRYRWITCRICLIWVRRAGGPAGSSAPPRRTGRSGRTRPPSSDSPRAPGSTPAAAQDPLRRVRAARPSGRAPPAASCAAARTPRRPRRTPPPAARSGVRRRAAGEGDQPGVHVRHRPEHAARHRPGPARGRVPGELDRRHAVDPAARRRGHPVGHLRLHHDQAAAQRRQGGEQVQHHRHGDVVGQVGHQRRGRVRRAGSATRAASAVTTVSRGARSGARAATVRGSSAASTGSTSTAITRRAAASRPRVSEPNPGPDLQHDVAGAEVAPAPRSAGPCPGR